MNISNVGVESKSCYEQWQTNTFGFSSGLSFETAICNMNIIKEEHNLTS